MMNEPSKPTFWQVCFSVLAAMFGVQSEKARARDFTQGNPLAYIAIGITFIVIFILLITTLVHLALHFAG